jgi:antitoxin component of RelBE/YafQ-DinJ toxin-antitoxin module
MKKNEYKKRDANGNQLPEQIGKGLNLEHLAKVKEAREVKNKTIIAKVTTSFKNKWQSKLKEYSLDESTVITNLAEIIINNGDLYMELLSENVKLKQTNKELIKKQIK